MSSRRGRGSYRGRGRGGGRGKTQRRHRSRKNTSLIASNIKQTPKKEEPIYIKECRSLLTQITRHDDCRPFRKLMGTNNPLYKDYKSINPNAISFSCVHI